MNARNVASIVGSAFWVEPSGSSTFTVGVVNNREAEAVEGDLKRAQRAVKAAGLRSRMAGRGVFKNLRVWA